MGYTNYWSSKVDQTEEDWQPFIKACRVLYKNMPEYSESAGNCYPDEPLFLGGCNRYEKAQFTLDHVYFNGSDGMKRIKKEGYWEDSSDKDLGHETFDFRRVVHHEFCKTARKPYDLMVCAVLILAKFYLKDIRVSSDGDEDDWKPALEFVGKHFPLASMNWKATGFGD